MDDGDWQGCQHSCSPEPLIVSSSERLSVAQALTQALGVRFDEQSRQSVSGGSINSAYKYSSAQQSVFVKTSAEARAEKMFSAEIAGLRELAGVQAVRVPQVMLHGRCREGWFLALEWINFGASSRSSEAALGEQLAWQHRKTRECHGWHMDNTIGSTPQVNTPCKAWPEFYGNRRLKFQLDLAAHNGAGADLVARGYRLCEQVPAFFTAYEPAASLLHGDLWGGNWRCDEEGMPVIFDPAVYYGDRETDIAMTRLFGGFGQGFYAAYESTWPLDADFEVRLPLYNLYHVLNHYNLFGGSYLSQAKNMIDALLAEVS
jgi:protein-ribulosamine 3-kinase